MEEVSGEGDGRGEWNDDDRSGVKVVEGSSVGKSSGESSRAPSEGRTSRRSKFKSMYRKRMDAAAAHMERVRAKSKSRDNKALEQQSKQAERALNMKKQVGSGQADLPKSKAAIPLPSITVRGRSKSRDNKALEQQSKQAERALNIKKQVGSGQSNLPKSSSPQTGQDNRTKPQPDQASTVETQPDEASTGQEKTAKSLRNTPSCKNIAEKIPAYLFIDSNLSKGTNLRLGNPKTLNFLQKFYLRMTSTQRHMNSTQIILIILLLITLPIATTTSFYFYIIAPSLRPIIIRENFYTSAYNAIVDTFNTILDYFI